MAHLWPRFFGPFFGVQQISRLRSDFYQGFRVRHSLCTCLLMFAHASAKTGPKPKGRKTYPEKYYCVPCDAHFVTNFGAMLAHANAHGRDDFVKIAQIKNGYNKGAHRPEQHIYDEENERFHKGSDAKYVKIVTPPRE